jgi:hypothetical protein
VRTPRGKRRARLEGRQMTRLDRPRGGRHARDRTALPQQISDSPIVGSAAEVPRTSFAHPEVFADPDVETANPGEAPVDAPSAPSRSTSSVARGVVGSVNRGEVIAARTALAMLTTALLRLGLHVAASGETMLLVWWPAANGQATARRTVRLGHHLGDAGRLWWWLWPPSDSDHRSPEGAWRSCWLAHRVLGPVDEVAKVADQLARALLVDAESRSSEDRTKQPAPRFGQT